MSLTHKVITVEINLKIFLNTFGNGVKKYGMKLYQIEIFELIFMAKLLDVAK